MEYNQPRRRARAFGLGILTGSAIEGGNLVDEIQSNLQFRLNSLTGMLSGDGDAPGIMDRRREIIRRRRQALLGEQNRDVAASQGNDRRTSGAISGGSSTRPSTSGSSQDAGVPSMTEANRGTVARARDHGFSET